MSPTVAAVIPARSGSKTIPHKNIREIGGFPLIAWSIAAARQAQLVDRVIVSTDSREYADLAISYGAEAPFLRPAELSGDTSTDIDFVMHLLEWLRENEGGVPDYLLHLRPPCPNRDPKVIDQAVKTIIADPTATSLLCAHPVDYPPSKYYRLGDNGDFLGYMGEEYINQPRQMCVQGYLGNGYADLMSVSSLLATRHLYGSKRIAFIAPNPGDIDTETEFMEMNAQLHRERSPLRSYLEDIKSRLPISGRMPFDELIERMPEFSGARKSLLQAASIIASCVKCGCKILAAGNGGSCSDALHFSGELLKSFIINRPIDARTAAALAEYPFGSEMGNVLEAGVPVVVLGQNSALTTAYLNDRKDSRAYLAQECLALARPGDVLVSFSTSGESESLLWAIAAMKARGGRNIAFTGKGGGRMGVMADIEIRSPAVSTPLVQEHHLPLYHALCIAVEADLFSPSAVAVGADKC